MQAVASQDGQSENSVALQGPRKYNVCALCLKQFLRVDTHLRKTHGLHSNPKEYARQLAASKSLKAEDIREVSTLGQLLDVYRDYLMSYEGANKHEQAARQEVARVRRFLEDLLDGHAYQPTLLRRLKDIGRKDNQGLLWRYENGQCRQGNPLKASTIGVYCQSLVNFCQFLFLHPENLRGQITQDEIRQWKTVAENCSKAFVCKRTTEDMARHEQEIGKYCHPAVFGRFLLSATVTGAIELLKKCVGKPALRTLENFLRIRDVIMLSAAITNGRRTGEIVNMTVDDFRKSHTSKSNPFDRIVFVKKHKVASKFCKINFYGTLYEAASKYVDCFADRFLSRAGKEGRMFPHYSHEQGPVPMVPSVYNKRIKHVWAEYVKVSKDPELPPPSHFCSSYIRKAFVTAVHPTGDRARMAEVASHMSHNLSTAEAHYDASGQLESTSRSTDYFRYLMWHADTTVSTAATAAGYKILCFSPVYFLHTPYVHTVVMLVV